METTTQNYPRTGQGQGQSQAYESREGEFTRLTESQTSKMPSLVFLFASLASMAASLTLRLMGMKHTSLFVGQWAPTLLILGLYNKMVKIGGSG